jgi:ATP-dependent Lhr-like helicase
VERLRARHDLDERAAANLLGYLDEQAGHRRVPDDRTIVVERFRDEIGDWRVCVLSPFGGPCMPRGRWRCGPGWPRSGG